MALLAKVASGVEGAKDALEREAWPVVMAELLEADKCLDELSARMPHAAAPEPAREEGEDEEEGGAEADAAEEGEGEAAGEAETTDEESGAAEEEGESEASEEGSEA